MHYQTNKTNKLINKYNISEPFQNNTQKNLSSTLQPKTIKHENNIITGIIGKKPVHLIRENQNSKSAYENLWIDIGAKNKEEASQVVSKGDYAYFSSDYEEMLNNRITGLMCY